LAGALDAGFGGGAPCAGPSVSPDWQKINASWTQDSSQAIEQHSGCTLPQIRKQQFSWEQNGVDWASKHEPVSGPPQVGASQPQEEMLVAIFTQLLSHADSQQNGSAVQTASQQSVLEQDGPTCGKQHGPVPLSPHSGGGHAASGPRAQDASAAATQLTSHTTSQQ
jgi:hypothetical protein